MLVQTNSFWNKRLLSCLRTVRHKNPLISFTTAKYLSSSVKDADGRKCNQHPTHKVACRGFKSGKVVSNGGRTDDFGPFKGTHSSVAFAFFFKLIWFSLLDKDVLRQFSRKQFLDGLKAAFLFVTNCLKNKQYESLSEVVTPQLLEKIKNGELQPKRKDIFRAEHVIDIQLQRINWNIDIKTKIKTIEVDVRFGFVNKVLQKEDIPQGWQQLFSLLMKTGRIAHFKFQKTYGEGVEDSDWIITFLKYSFFQDI